eukprot:TRINITY_DN1223_c0_g1_i6.p1 TRINITY_DN1223_c0_g1~~TRINITY_DN1223_c0_g1_i6.p1  ORF type:complete len:903 (-),score=127.16 TRINITY_DN1223_c0_g1_i6:441-2792(-)
MMATVMGKVVDSHGLDDKAVMARGKLLRAFSSDLADDEDIEADGLVQVPKSELITVMRQLKQMKKCLTSSGGAGSSASGSSGGQRKSADGRARGLSLEVKMEKPSKSVASAAPVTPLRTTGKQNELAPDWLAKAAKSAKTEMKSEQRDKEKERGSDMEITKDELREGAKDESEEETESEDDEDDSESEAPREAAKSERYDESPETSQEQLKREQFIESEGDPSVSQGSTLGRGLVATLRKKLTSLQVNVQAKGSSGHHHSSDRRSRRVKEEIVQISDSSGGEGGRSRRNKGDEPTSKRRKDKRKRSLTMSPESGKQRKKKMAKERERRRRSRSRSRSARRRNNSGRSRTPLSPPREQSGRSRDAHRGGDRRSDRRSDGRDALSSRSSGDRLIAVKQQPERYTPSRGEVSDASNFIRRHACRTHEEPFTHSSMLGASDPFSTSGHFHFGDDRSSKEELARALEIFYLDEGWSKLYFTEHPTDLYAYVEDIDVEGTRDSGIPKLMCPASDDYELLLWRATALRRQFPKATMRCALYESSGWYSSSELYKESYHVVWLDIIVDKPTAVQVRRASIEYLEEEAKKPNHPLGHLLRRVSSINPYNTWNRIFDETAVRSKIGLRMPLCDKRSLKLHESNRRFTDEYRPVLPVGLLEFEFVPNERDRSGEVCSRVRVLERCDKRPLWEWALLGMCRRPSSVKPSYFVTPVLKEPVVLSDSKRKNPNRRPGSGTSGPGSGCSSRFDMKGKGKGKDKGKSKGKGKDKGQGKGKDSKGKSSSWESSSSRWGRN